MNQVLYNKAKGRSRQSAIEQGAYDGRFRTKIVVNKKKNEFKKLRNTKHQIQKGGYYE